jgi:hypothetical protein
MGIIGSLRHEDITSAWLEHQAESRSGIAITTPSDRPFFHETDAGEMAEEAQLA